MPSVGEFLLRPGTEPIPDTLLTFLRVYSMQEEQLTHWLHSDKVFELKHADSTKKSEMHVVEEVVKQFLLSKLKRLIANYPTTLEVKAKPDFADTPLSIAHCS